ncbi:MAG: hypothetical protein ACM3KM_02240, partial [Acidobacteriaceae bacterium]
MSNKPKRGALIRFLEIFPGVLTWITLLGAPILAYYQPVWISVYIILFDLYWFLKGGNVAIHLLHSYNRLKVHKKIDWLDWSKRLFSRQEFIKHLQGLEASAPKRDIRRLYHEHQERMLGLEESRNTDWRRIYHLIILPTVKEEFGVLNSSIKSYFLSDYPKDRMIFVLATEERAGELAEKNGELLTREYGDKFFKFLVT